MYDDKWRVIARFEDGAAVNAPFEQVYHHYAGLAGYGGSSYIDLVIARDRDTSTGDAGFETREYVLQNWRADVVALVAPGEYGEGGALVEAGRLLERVSYDPYGIPFGTYPTDLTLGAIAGNTGYGMPSGTVNNDDYNYFLTLYTNTDWRADWNKDGTLDSDDNTEFLADHGAASGSWGRGVLSNRQNILGYAGYVHEPATGSAGGGHGTMYHCRLRVHHAGLGRWIQRDPPRFEYREGPSLYWYASGAPVVMSDSSGGPAVPVTSPAACSPAWSSVTEMDAADIATQPATGLTMSRGCANCPAAQAQTYEALAITLAITSWYECKVRYLGDDLDCHDCIEDAEACAAVSTSVKCLGGTVCFDYPGCDNCTICGKVSTRTFTIRQVRCPCVERVALGGGVVR